MTYYHSHKSEAALVAESIKDDPRIGQVTIQLEPDYGWVVVCVPRLHDLSDLGDRVEVRDPWGRRLTPRPVRVPIVRAPAPTARVLVISEPGSIIPPWLA
jgi:hypothetical protein